MTPSTALRPLSPAEARVLSTLMEKARTVPDTYPMTLNGLLSGCNQKTSREPVMNLAEPEVLEALDGLRDLGLISESSGGRAARFGHQFQRAYGVPEQSAVLLGLLMLRGPQTAGELRLNAERWYRFADISSVEAFLDELQERSLEKGGALVLKLPRAPGAREQRWAHLLCGPVDVDSLGSSGASAQAGGLAQRLATLEAEVAHLRAALERVCAELGLPAPSKADWAAAE
jgi:uncharacterized protein YceH (UPF0502 family)